MLFQLLDRKTTLLGILHKMKRGKWMFISRSAVGLTCLVVASDSAAATYYFIPKESGWMKGLHGIWKPHGRCFIPPGTISIDGRIKSRTLDAHNAITL